MLYLPRGRRLLSDHETQTGLPAAVRSVHLRLSVQCVLRRTLRDLDLGVGHEHQNPQSVRLRRRLLFIHLLFQYLLVGTGLRLAGQEQRQTEDYRKFHFSFFGVHNGRFSCCLSMQ